MLASTGGAIFIFILFLSILCITALISAFNDPRTLNKDSKKHLVGDESIRIDRPLNHNEQYI